MKPFKPTLAIETRLVDLTPLVDVVFLLLIFFILSADLLPLRSIKVDSPHLELTSQPLATQIVVILDSDHGIYCGKRREMVDFTTLKATLLAEIATVNSLLPDVKPAVVLSVDKSVEYAYFLRLFSIVQECTNTIRLVYHSTAPSSNNAAIVAP